MSTGQILKEVYEKKIEEQIKILNILDKDEQYYDLDSVFIRHVLRDSIKFYYEK